MIIAIDFDGTCVYHDYPYVGKDIGAVPVLKELVAAGHKLKYEVDQPRPYVDWEKTRAMLVDFGLIED